MAKYPDVLNVQFVKKKSFKTGKYYPCMEINLKGVDGNPVPLTCLIRYQDFRILGITEDMFPIKDGN